MNSLRVPTYDTRNIHVLFEQKLIYLLLGFLCPTYKRLSKPDYET